jgi:hypothetical protein
MLEFTLLLCCKLIPLIAIPILNASMETATSKQTFVHATLTLTAFPANSVDLLSFQELD